MYGINVTGIGMFTSNLFGLAKSPEKLDLKSLIDLGI